MKGDEHQKPPNGAPRSLNLKTSGVSSIVAKVIFYAVIFATSYTVADDTGPPDFSKYPPCKNFDYFVEAHRSGEFFFDRPTNDQSKAGNSLLLAISRFTSDTGNSALDYFVTSSGFEMDCREMPYWATQAAFTKQLTDEQLAKLKAAIANLPKVNTYPPLNTLVIVSFRDGEAWVTRTCSPEDVRVIHGIIGERRATAGYPK